MEELLSHSYVLSNHSHLHLISIIQKLINCLQNTAKLPPALIHSRGTSNLTLFISSLSPEISPISIPLTSLTIHPSLLKVIRTDRHAIPPRAGEPAFRPQEELAHTFKVEEKSVGAFISLIGLGITLSPWLVLVAMVSIINLSLILLHHVNMWQIGQC